MGKYAEYENLGLHLMAQGKASIPMTFSEIEEITGRSLPPSAKYPAWWSNNPSNNAMTKVWLEAGFKTEQVDIKGRKLVFRRVKSLHPVPQIPSGMPDSARSYPGPKPISSANAGADPDSWKGQGGKAASQLSPAPTVSKGAGAPSRIRHPTFGSMKGLISIAPGVDLTEPAADPDSWKDLG